MLPEILIPGTISLAALSAKLINNKHASDRLNQLYTQLTEINNGLTANKLDRPSYYISNKLKDSLQLDVPIERVTDNRLAKALGVDSNAYYVRPEYAESFADVLGTPDSYKKSGLIVMGDNGNFGNTVTLAHELGHARDYKDGKLPNPVTNNIIGLGGIGGSVALGLLAHSDIKNTLTNLTGSSTAGAIGSSVAVSLPSILAGLWLIHRQVSAERRASKHAIGALSTLVGKMRSHGAYDRSKQSLDSALETYKVGGRRDAVNHVLNPIIWAGALAALGGGIKLLSGRRDRKYAK